MVPCIAVVKTHDWFRRGTDARRVDLGYISSPNVSCGHRRRFNNYFDDLLRRPNVGVLPHFAVNYDGIHNTILLISATTIPHILWMHKCEAATENDVNLWVPNRSVYAQHAENVRHMPSIDCVDRTQFGAFERNARTTSSTVVGCRNSLVHAFHRPVALQRL